MNGTAYATSYTYDAVSQLLTIEDAQGNDITFSYDTFGRKTSLVDPDLGTWNYTYDAAGNLVSQRDGRGVTVSLSYDALNRVTRKNGTSSAMDFTYDTIAKGTLAKVALTSANKTFAYDQRLRRTQENLSIDGITFSTNYSYDSADHLIQKNMTNGTSIRYTYNAFNKPESITGIINDFDYVAVGQPSGRAYNNTLTTNLTYDTNSLRLSRIYTGTKQNMSYSYDAVGNILLITDVANNASETYTYDDLNRISTANRIVNGTTQFSAAYTVSPINVITKIVTNSWTKTFSFGSAPVHAPSEAAE